MSLHVFTCIYSLTQPEKQTLYTQLFDSFDPLPHYQVSLYSFPSMANPLTAAHVYVCVWYRGSI